MSWIRTRMCYCGECRFHSTSEPGWEVCPDSGNPKKKNLGKWLYVKKISSNLDLENQDEAYLKQQARRAAEEEDD